MSESSDGRRRGAVRSEKSRLAILTAAAELIARDGYEHLTIEGIAARAKVGKPTIYRWWDSKSALIAECLDDGALLPGAFLPPSTGDLLADISVWFDGVVGFVSDANNTAVVRSLIAAAIDNPEVALQLTHRLGATPESLEGRLREAVNSGELKPGTNVDQLTEVILGVVVYRILSREGLAPSDTASLVPMMIGGSLAR